MHGGARSGAPDARRGDPCGHPQAHRSIRIAHPPTGGRPLPTVQLADRKVSRDRACRPQSPGRGTTGDRRGRMPRRLPQARPWLPKLGDPPFLRLRPEVGIVRTSPRAFRSGVGRARPEPLPWFQRCAPDRIPASGASGPSLPPGDGSRSSMADALKKVARSPSRCNRRAGIANVPGPVDVVQMVSAGRGPPDGLKKLVIPIPRVSPRV